MPAPLRVAALALTFAVLAATGGWLLFSHFALYDDESYILLAARDAFLHGHLYESVYSQYGPAFHLGADLFQRLFGLLDHSSARWLTLLLWLGTAAACANLVARQTRSTALTAATLATSFLYLYFFTDEPFHPGSLIVFVLAVSVLVLTELLPHRPHAAAIVAGVGVAVLALTKINVGAFYLVALSGWALLPATHTRLHRAILLGAALAFALLLMRPLLQETWIQLYALQFAVGAATLLAVIERRSWVTRRHTIGFFFAGAATTVVILGAIRLRGTSWSGLLEGVLLGPLRHPANYAYAVDWRPGTLALALLSPVLLPVHRWLARRESSIAADRLIVILRVAQAAALVFAFLAIMELRVIGAVFSYVAPLIWTWVIPLSRRDPDPLALPRGLLATVLLLQYLHAYPVGGSQEAWGTFLFLPLVALGLHETHRWFAASAAAPRLWRLGGAIALTLLAGKLAWTAHSARATYAARQDLALPGAAALRLPEETRTAYRLLAQNAAVHADVLFSLPGLFGFNLWTDLPTPTSRNATLWFSLLSERDQAAIQRALERTPRAAVIVQQDLLQLMAAGGVVPQGPLAAYLAQNFQPVFRVEGFAFLVKPDRRIAALGVARLAAPQRIELCLPGDGTPIAAIELHDLFADSAPLALTAANASVQLAPINRAGDSRQPPALTPWPLRFQGLARLVIEVVPPLADRPPARTILRCKDARGVTLTEARFAE